jgi:hypothetical protein
MIVKEREHVLGRSEHDRSALAVMRKWVEVLRYHGALLRTGTANRGPPQPSSE